MTSGKTSERRQFLLRLIEVGVSVIGGWLAYWALLAEPLARRLHTYEANFLSTYLIAMICIFVICDVLFANLNANIWKSVVAGSTIGYVSGVISYVSSVIGFYVSGMAQNVLPADGEIWGTLMIWFGFPLFTLHCWIAGLVSAVLLVAIRRIFPNK